MNQKQKEEWLDLFTEAFTGVVLPRLEPLEKDVSGLKENMKEVKKRLSTIERDISVLKKDMKEVKEIIAHLKTHPVQRAL